MPQQMPAGKMFKDRFAKHNELLRIGRQLYYELSSAEPDHYLDVARQKSSEPTAPKEDAMPKQKRDEPKMFAPTRPKTERCLTTTLAPKWQSGSPGVPAAPKATRGGHGVRALDAEPKPKPRASPKRAAALAGVDVALRAGPIERIIARFSHDARPRGRGGDHGGGSLIRSDGGGARHAAARCPTDGDGGSSGVPGSQAEGARHRETPDSQLVDHLRRRGQR